MTCWAPHLAAIVHFSSEPAVAITVAPNARATCTDARPTPPAPACTRTVSPACTCVDSVRATTAVVAATGIAAASTRSQLSGTVMAMSSRAIACSAKAPQSTFETTRSPTVCVQSVPVAITIPDSSCPGVNGRSGRTWYWLLIINRSLKLSAAPCTSTTSSPAAGWGVAWLAKVSSLSPSASGARHAAVVSFT